MNLFTPFPIFEMIVVIVFVIVIGASLFPIIRAIAKRQRNNAQPVLSVLSRVVAKRTRVSGSSSSNYGSTSTYYYCTFEDEYGQRYELQVSGKEYGQLVEGDVGTLTYQGTRYHEFQRQKK